MSEIHLLDRVELTSGTEDWPAGTVGTVVDEFDGGVMVELVGPDGATLALLDLPLFEVRLVGRDHDGLSTLAAAADHMSPEAASYARAAVENWPAAKAAEHRLPAKF